MSTKATKTIKQVLSYKPQHAAWFERTQALFNKVVGFYFEVIQAHQLVLSLSNKEALTALEKLTHATTDHPNPVMPLSDIAPGLPTVSRRAAINAALGSAKSFYTALSKWRKRKEAAQTKGKKWTIRPPIPPRQWNRSVTCYREMWKPCEGSSIMLKLWTGSSWVWVKVGICGRRLPESWEQSSPQLVKHGSNWHLHIPIEREVARPPKVETQITTNQETKICAVDLNLNEQIAVCTIQTVEGTILATKFIGGGRRISGFRKKQLGRIARNRGKTGIIAEGEQDNKHLWAKIRAVDENVAHQVSHRIVEFAKAYGATVLVFEHLGSLKPTKGKYSNRGNEKRAYWMKGRIFKYAKYKAWNNGILTSRVNPRNTSRACARCGALVARYDAGQPAEGYTPGAPLVYCANCNKRDHSDRNASLVIGQRLLARYQPQEKPQAPLVPKTLPERPVKAGGVLRSQAARRRRRPSTQSTRHGMNDAQGTAQGALSGMVDNTSGIPRQLRMFNE
jgi:IS605 OrfB family transposase